MGDFVVIVILLLVIGAAVAYIIKAKKSGVKCIGCPAAGTCAHKNNGTSGCGGCGSNGQSQCNCHTDSEK